MSTKQSSFSTVSIKCLRDIDKNAEFHKLKLFWRPSFNEKPSLTRLVTDAFHVPECKELTSQRELSESSDNVLIS